jgi:hypothetical protein
MTAPVSSDSTYAPFAGSWIAHVLRFTNHISERYGKVPESGSQAEQEIDHSVESGPGGPWPALDRSRPYEIAGGLMTLAMAHLLASLQSMIGPEMALFGFQSVTRSIVEAGARAAWVLDTGIGIRERVVRSSLLELESIREGRLVEIAAGGDGSNFNQKVVDLKIRLALLGIDEKLDKNGRLIGVDARTLGSRLDSVKKFVPELGVPHGEMWYRSMSGVSHSVLYGVTEYLRAGPADATGKTKPVAELPIHAVANAAVMSLDAYLLVVQRHSELWGRDAASVAGKRLEMKGELLSAINRPELRSFPR